MGWRWEVQLRALQKVEQGLAGFLQRGGGQPGAGDQDQIRAGSVVLSQSKGHVRKKSPHRFAQKTLRAIASHSASGGASRRHSNSYAGLRILFDNQNDKRVGIGPAGTPHPLEIFRPGQTELSLHPRSIPLTSGLSSHACWRSSLIARDHASGGALTQRARLP